MSTLAERERALSSSLDPYERAKRVAPKLAEIGQEIAFTARTEAAKELADLAVQQLADAAECLRILAIEVVRLRQGIGCHEYGRLEASALWRMAKNWSAAARTPETPHVG